MDVGILHLLLHHLATAHLLSVATAIMLSISGQEAKHQTGPREIPDLLPTNELTAFVALSSTWTN